MTGKGARMTVGDRVAVWWMAVDQVDDAQWAALGQGLEPHERARAARFHFDHDRRAYVAAHALGRALLADWTGLAGPDWRFQPGEHGKPEVVAPPWPRRLRLNLSHTRGLAAAVLTEEHDVGIDVEWLDRNSAADDVAERFFARSECVLLRRARPAERMPTFLALWTLKEAYVKAIGKGLAQPLDAFAFDLTPLSISFADAGADDPRHWLFMRWRPGPAHVMALALRHPDPAAIDVRCVGLTASSLLAGGRDGLPLDFVARSSEA